MNTTLILKASLLIALVSSANLLAAQPVTRVGERPITRAEVMIFVGEQFTAADADKDGAVTKSELQAFRASLDTRDRAAFDEIAAQSFDHADIDADGEIARWEVDQRATQLFDMVDVDRNGIASIEEQGVAAALTNLETENVENFLGRFRSGR